MDDACRLCRWCESRLLYRGEKRSFYREFFHCPVCDLVYVPDRYLLSPADEKARYELHRNDPDDPGYRSFLRRLMDEVLPLLEPGMEGLDLGSGPTSVLAAMFEEAGFPMCRYDPYFHADDSALERTYDFITCSETVEHFRDAQGEFGRLNDLLRPGGILGIMTAMLGDWADFPDWHYHTDATHICYYSPRTMRWIASRYVWRLNLPAPNIAIAENRDRS